MPTAEGGRGLDIVANLRMDDRHRTGTFLGYIGFGFLADRFSRKYTYIGFLVIAALLVPVFAFVRNPNALLVIGPLVGFFGTGYLRIQRNCQRALPYRPARLCDGLRL